MTGGVCVVCGIHAFPGPDCARREMAALHSVAGNPAAFDATRRTGSGGAQGCNQPPASESLRLSVAASAATARPAMVSDQPPDVAARGGMPGCGRAKEVLNKCFYRHASAGGHRGTACFFWIPACAGMTLGLAHQLVQGFPKLRAVPTLVDRGKMETDR